MSLRKKVIGTLLAGALLGSSALSAAKPKDNDPAPRPKSTQSAPAQPKPPQVKKQAPPAPSHRQGNEPRVHAPRQRAPDTPSYHPQPRARRNAMLHENPTIAHNIRTKILGATTATTIPAATTRGGNTDGHTGTHPDSRSG